MISTEASLSKGNGRGLLKGTVENCIFDIFRLFKARNEKVVKYLIRFEIKNNSILFFNTMINNSKRSTTILIDFDFN